MKVSRRNATLIFVFAAIISTSVIAHETIRHTLDLACVSMILF